VRWGKKACRQDYRKSFKQIWLEFSGKVKLGSSLDFPKNLCYRLVNTKKIVVLSCICNTAPFFTIAR